MIRVLTGWWILPSLVYVSAISAQSLEEYSPEVLPIVRGLSVYALENERNFPVVIRDSLDQFGLPVRSRNYITIQFDVLATEPPPLKIRFLHCDRNWLPDDNVLVQDENHNTLSILTTGLLLEAWRTIATVTRTDFLIKKASSGSIIRATGPSR